MLICFHVTQAIVSLNVSVRSSRITLGDGATLACLWGIILRGLIELGRHTRHWARILEKETGSRAPALLALCSSTVDAASAPPLLKLPRQDARTTISQSRALSPKLLLSGYCITAIGKAARAMC